MFRAAIIFIALLGVTATALALEPAQVVVVVNSKSDESVALGRFYCKMRQVPLDNLIALSLPTSDDIPAQEYDTLLVKPLRQALQERKLTDTVRCLLMIRGVPFRVLERPRDATSQTQLDWYQAGLARCSTRMQEDMRLMEQVAKPAPARTNLMSDLYDRDQWFDVKTSATAPAAVSATEDNFWSQAKSKILEIHRLGSDDKASLAQKQWLALCYDAFGLEGLAKAVFLSPSPDNPSRSDIEDRTKPLTERVQTLAAPPSTTQKLAELEVAYRQLRGVFGMQQQFDRQVTNQNIATSRAAVDNELALLFWDGYNYDGMMTNPLHWQVRSARAQMEKKGGGRALMVSRLDGPLPTQMMRMILDGLAAEKNGLTGRLYIDAGAGPNGAEAYNQHFANLADVVKRHTKIPVKMDNRPGVFEPNECPDAALYVGWYSLQKYVPAFTWVPGAVGYHIASWEAVHLRDPNSQEWVPRMIAGRVSATLGACDEPFLHAFPVPEEFLTLILSGKMTVCEAYWLTLPHVSWRIMLIADPLYNPFAAAPQPVDMPPGMMTGLN
jgi:uncharacterized protein (TIGR03790 family)